MRPTRIDKEVFLNLPHFKDRNSQDKMFLLDKSILQFEEQREIFVGVVTENEEEDFVNVIKVQVISDD